MTGTVHQSSVDAAQAERGRFSLLIELATDGVVAYSVALPLMHLYGISVDLVDPGRAVPAAVATVCYLPVQTWLVLSAARGSGGPGRRWALAALAVAMIVMLPVVGVAWFGNLYLLVALALVTIRPPWSIVLVAGTMVGTTPVTVVLGHPEWAGSYTIATPYVAVPMAVGIWFIRAARRLQATRLALAEAAIVRERFRVDDQLRSTVGVGLDAIAADGERIGGLVASGSPATRELRALVDAARQTSVEARRTVRRYREVSLRAELETAATLLSAAGIQTRLDLPPGELSDAVDDRDRAALRRDIALLLGGPVPVSIVITLAHHGGRMRPELRSPDDPEATGSAVG
jgi:hypothetical protein